MRNFIWGLMFFLLFSVESSYSDCGGQPSFFAEVENADFVGLIHVGIPRFHGYFCRVEEVIAAKDSIPQNIMIWGSGAVNAGFDCDQINKSEGRLQIAAVKMRKRDGVIKHDWMYFQFIELKGSFHTSGCGNNFVALKDSIVEGKYITKSSDYCRTNNIYNPIERIDYKEFKKMVKENFKNSIY